MPKNIFKNKVLYLGLLLIGIFLGVNSSSAATSLASRLSGYILLQVESVGEAWYVIPKEQKMVYMKDGAVAYQIMREVSLGITNSNLAKIPVGIESRFNDVDTDGDGLSNHLETGLDTDPNKADTDGDGFSDGEEIKNNFSPIGKNKLVYDQNLVNRLRGYILLQVEKQGQAWYVNPKDGKRYYMQDGPAAYNIMRYLSLGITNKNLNTIPKSSRVFNVDTSGNNSSNQGNQNNQGNNNSTSTPPTSPPGNSGNSGGGGGGGGGTRPPTPNNDQDNDGYVTTASGGNDCNDSNPSIHPGATDTCGNNVDEDCSGTDLQCVLPDYDQDNDGYDSVASGGTDCNDNNSAIHPGASEVLGNNIDDNCNNQTDENNIPVTDNSAPSAPSSLSGTTSGTQVVLTWTQSTDNIGVYQYDIERQISAITGYQNIASVNATTYTNIDLTPSGTYTYRIKARDLAGNSSGYSNTFTITTNATPDTTRPSTPTNLSASVSGTQISLTWTASTDNIAVYQYHIERSTDNSTFSEIATTNITSYVNSGLLNGTTYYYRVRARDAALNYSLNFSSVVSATTATAVIPPSTSVSINGVTGTMSNGQTVTISGSGFGTKTTVAPIVYDTMESGSFSSGWESNNHLVIGSNVANKRHANANYYGTHNFQANLYRSAGYFTGPNNQVRDTWYGRYWFKLDNNWDWGINVSEGTDGANLNNVKIFRLWNPGNIQENFVTAIHGFAGGSTLYTTEYVTSDPIPNYAFLNANDISKDSWHVFDFEFKEGTVGSYNSTFRMWFDGKKVADKSDLLTRNYYSDLKRPLILGFYNSIFDNSADRDDFYIDDAYIDGTWSRVMLCNQSVWNDTVTRHCEIQSPQNTWNNNSVQINFNPGSFTSGQTAYLYVVDSNGNVNSSGYPVVISGTSVADQIAPTTPTNLSVTVSGTQISLNWTASTDNVAVSRYLVERSTSASSGFTQIGTPTTNLYTDSGLNNSTTYYYRVRAQDAAGNTSISYASGSATTGAVVQDTQAPTTPTNLSATVSGNQASLSWSASTDSVGVTGYQILRSTTNGSGYTLVSTSNTTSYTDSSLPVATYYYVVKAYDAAGNTSTNSNQATAQITTSNTSCTPITITNLTSSIGTSNPQNTASVTATSGSVMYLTVGLSFMPVSFPSDSINISGLGATWTKVSTNTFGYRRRVWLFKGVGGSGTGPVTINYNGINTTSLQEVGWVLDKVTGLDLTTPNDSVTTVETAGVSPSSLTVSTSNTPGTCDVTYSSLVLENQQSTNVESGWSSLGQTSTGSLGVRKVASAWDDARDTSHTWSWLSGSYAAAFITVLNNSSSVQTPTSDQTAPTAPSSLSASVSGTQISLNWSAAYDANGVAQYIIETSNGGAYTQAGTTNSTTYTVSGLTASTAYSCRVKAQDVAGNMSSYSNVVTATTGATPVSSSVSIAGVSDNTIANGQSITISGSGFGTKNRQQPLLFDDISSITGYQGYLQNNTIVPTRGCAFGSTSCEANPQPINSSLPWYNHWYGGTPRFYIGSSSRYTGHPAYRATNLEDDFSTKGFFARDFAVNTAEGWTNLDWWIRSNLPFGEGPGGGVSGKILRLWHHPDLVDQIVLVNMPNPVFIVDRGCTVHTNPDIQYLASYPLNQWTHLSVMTKVLSSGTEAHILVNGELSATVTGFCGNNGIYDYLRMVGLDPSYPEYLDPSLEFLWGDIYFDDSLSRVVLSDSSSFNPFGGSSTNHYEVQNIQSWSNGSVSLKINQGSFTSGQTAYLYVVDSNGNVNSSGYPVTISGVLGTNVSSCNTPDQDTINWTQIPNNTLVRGCGSAIYVIQNNKRIHITSLDILRNQYPGQRIYNIDNDLLESYPL